MYKLYISRLTFHLSLYPSGFWRVSCGSNTARWRRSWRPCGPSWAEPSLVPPLLPSDRYGPHYVIVCAPWIIMLPSCLFTFCSHLPVCVSYITTTVKIRLAALTTGCLLKSFSSSALTMSHLGSDPKCEFVCVWRSCWSTWRPESGSVSNWGESWRSSDTQCASDDLSLRVRSNFHTCKLLCLIISWF